MAKKPTYEELEQRVKALQESEEKYRKIFEAVPLSMIVIDKEGKMTDVSPHQVYHIAKGLTPREDYIGNDLITHPTIVDAGLSETYKRLLKGKSFDLKEVFFPSIQRGIGGYYFNIKGAPLLKDGEIFGAITIHEEVTDRKQAEEALRKSEELLSAIADRSPIPTVVGASDGSIISFNEALEKLTEYTRSEITDVTDWANKLYPDKEYRDFVWKNIEQALRGEKQDCTEFMITCKDGTTRTLDFHTSFFKHGLIIQMVDVTQRRRTEEALRESEEKYRTILASIEDGYFEVDIAGNFTFFNDSLCKILAYSKDELMGMNNRQYTDEENAKKLYKTFNKVYTTGKPDKGFDWEIIRKDGGKRYVEASVSLRKDPEGKPTGFRGIIRDITERKQV